MVSPVLKDTLPYDTLRRTLTTVSVEVLETDDFGR